LLLEDAKTWQQQLAPSIANCKLVTANLLVLCLTFYF
jgi:hypothetical protein